MKRYRIVHQTNYLYSGPVRLGSHALRLRPREGHDLRIESSSITIQPQAFLRWHRDVEGNSVAIADFDDATDRLLVGSTLIVEQYDQQPLDFLVEDYAVLYPFAYTADDHPVLQPYLFGQADPRDQDVAQWLASVWRCGESIESYGLLQRFNLAVHARITYRRREEPGVQTPAETLRKGSGSCRDLAYLFMDVAKQLGFAARFVSGYSYTPYVAEDGGSTHAWVEVFLPGAGWKGFDPTRGEIVGGHYIPVAVARLPHSVPPIAGSFRGNACLLSLDVDVSVQALESTALPGQA